MTYPVLRIDEACVMQPPKKEAREKITDGDTNISFMGMEDLGIYTKYAIPTKQRTFESAVKGYTYFSEGDVLIAKITPCFENGKLGVAKNLLNGIGFGSTEFIVLRTREMVLPEWVYYFLSLPFVREDGKDLMTGAVGHKRIPKEYLGGLKIPVPPLEVQEEEIRRLDAELDDVNSAMALVEQQKELLDRLEESLVYEMLGLAK